MWLEVPRKCCKVEDLYYQVLLSLFSLITSCVEGVVSEAARPLLTKLNQVSGGWRLELRDETYVSLLGLYYTT